MVGSSMEIYQATILSPWANLKTKFGGNVYKALVRTEYDLVRCRHIDGKSPRSQPPHGECMLWCSMTKHTYHKIKYDKRFNVLWATRQDGAVIDEVKYSLWDKVVSLAMHRLF